MAPPTTHRDFLRARLRDDIRMLAHCRTAAGALVRQHSKNQGDVTRAIEQTRQKNADLDHMAKVFGFEIVESSATRTLK